MCRKLTWLVSLVLLLSLGHSASAASNPNPPDGATGVPIDVILNWFPEHGAVSYNVYFGTSNPPVLAGNVASSSFDPGTLELGTTYYLRIDEIEADETIHTGVVWSFTTMSTPLEATNPYPADGATDVSIDVVLNWDPGKGVLMHHVYFGTSSPPPWIGSQTATSYDPGTLEPGTTYFWRINEFTATGINPGPVWSFTTMSGPVEATNPYPADGATDVPIAVSLSWTAGFGATSHDVYFGTSSPPAFIYRTANGYSPGTLEPGTTYYWKIDEVVPVVEGPPIIHEGDVWSFTTKSTPVEAKNPYPADGATDVFTDIVLSWTPDPRATSHDVYLGTSSSPPFMGNQIRSDYNPGTLEPDTRYWWHIDTIIQMGEFFMVYAGDLWSFTTEPMPVVTAATNPSPAVRDTCIDILDLELSWDPGYGAISHDVYFGTDFDAVANADTSDTTGIYRGRQDANGFVPSGLALGTDYYWKINEVVPVIEGPPIIIEGDVWEFTTITGPEKATKPSPADGAIGISPAPLLSTYISDDVPLNIPDRGRVETTVFSSLDIPGSFTITDLNVQLNITMPVNNADLNVFLIGPDDTRVELFTDVGATTKDGFTNTVLDDEASISVRDGRGNFAGIYRPEGKLSDFDGKNAQGTWTLEITDDWANNAGILNSWQLIIESTNIISWVPGAGIASQDVYFSNNFNDVNDSAEAAYQGNFAADVSTIEVVLDPDQTYFWQIDSLDADGMLIKAGDVWSFTTKCLWTQVNEDGFGDPNNAACYANTVFQEYLYTGSWNEVTGGEIWRSSDGIIWTQVNIDGFGDPNNWGAFPCGVFEDKLYVGTCNEVTGGEIWRSSDGITWTQVNIDGFGNSNNTDAYPLVVFGSNLYAGTWNFVSGTEVWRSSEGTTWIQVNIDGFGDPNNVYTEIPVVFEGFLYAGTLNEATGGEIWRTADGTTWTQVNINGFGDPNNVRMFPYSILDGFLYTGTTNEVTGGEIWRTSDGTTWIQVNIDGFGDSNNAECSPFVVFEDHVYAGTTNEVTGAEVWRTSDGTTWIQVNIDGFGDPNTLSASPYSVFNGNLYAGSWNPVTGSEVWVLAGGKIWTELSIPYDGADHVLVDNLDSLPHKAFVIASAQDNVMPFTVVAKDTAGLDIPNSEYDVSPGTSSMILEEDATQYAVRMPLLVDGEGPLARISIANRDRFANSMRDRKCGVDEFTILNAKKVGTYWITVFAFFDKPDGTRFESECPILVTVTTYDSGGTKVKSDESTVELGGVSPLKNFELLPEDPDKLNNPVRIEVKVKCKGKKTDADKKCRFSWEITVPS